MADEEALLLWDEVALLLAVDLEALVNSLVKGHRVCII